MLRIFPPRVGDRCPVRRRTALGIERLESRTVLAAIVANLAADWSDVQNPNQAWSLNAGTQPLAAQNDWNQANQAAWTHFEAGSIRLFQSAADLDFRGEFVYAINAGGPDKKRNTEPVAIGDAHFVDGTIAKGMAVMSARQEAANWYPDADYGSTADDNTLEFVMQSIRWDRRPSGANSEQASISISLDTQPGHIYKLQMLFAELRFERGFDIVINGEVAVSDFVISREQGGINNKDTGVVVTHEFMATDSQLTIEFKGDAGVSNDDPILNGLTLEKLPERLGNGAPSWLQLATGVPLGETTPQDFRSGDVLVQPTLAGGGYGAANVTWIANQDALLTVSGSLWSAASATANTSWKLSINDSIVTSGTILAGEFNRANPFDLRKGSGGADAIRNVSVQSGDVLRLTLASDQAEFIGVDLTVASDTSHVPRYALGAIPDQNASAGTPLQFYVDVPDGASLPAMHVSGLTAQADPPPRVTLDADGLLTYIPTTNQQFDLTVTLQETESDMADGEQSQQFTIRTRQLRDELEWVAQPGPLPDPTSDAYLSVSESLLHDNVLFNTQLRATRQIELSGKVVRLVPGDINGLFERLAYTGGATNSDLEKLLIAAETVVIGGNLHLPATDVTIHARELRFEDADGRTGRLDTTPLAYASAAAPARPAAGHITPATPGANGQRGADAGDVTLNVASISIPEGGPSQRFVLRGGTGQAAGAGIRGENGVSRSVLTIGENPFLWSVLSQYPTATYVVTYNLFGAATQYGSPNFPTDGTDAIPGGRPGDGGRGGRLRSTVPLDAIADVSGGAAGRPAQRLVGGQAGTPLVATHIEIPFIGGWDVTERRQTNGAGWNPTNANAGALGNVALLDDAAATWLHPSSARAMIAYAKDAYRNGHRDLAAELFRDYGNRLDEAALAPTALIAEFAELRAEVTTMEHQLTSQLDYFGNPAGWAPTLSFAANYRAYENEIDSDLRTLFLTRLIQAADKRQQNQLDALGQLLNELDSVIDHATDNLNAAQSQLPGLYVELQDIETRTAELRDELAVREAAQRSQASGNLLARSILETIGGLLSVVPIPAVSGLGAGLTAVSHFLADPSLNSLINSATDISSSFKQQALDKSSTAIAQQLDLLDPPSQVNALTHQTYADQLGKLVSQWRPVVAAYQQVSSATQVSADDVEVELQKLAAKDATLRGLIGQVTAMLGQKQSVAQRLAQTINVISANLQTIATGYATAEALSRERTDISPRVSLPTMDRVAAMERNARDRLLRFQYSMAKAFEYETLQPYSGQMGLNPVLDEIVRLLSPPINADESWLDNPQNFATLKSIYESELRDVADQIWTELNTNAPQRTSEIKLTLSPVQLQTLNSQGELTINLVEMGFINAARQDVKLLEMGVDRVQSSLESPSAVQAANLQFRFEHSGHSVVQSGGTKYAFQHPTRNNSSYFWSTDYDAIGGELTQSEISPADVQNVSALLGLNAGTLESPYAHPGAWAEITIRTSADVVPSATRVDLQAMTLYVRYDSELPASELVLLDVRAPETGAPRVVVSRMDASGRDTGDGSFTRYYGRGTQVTLNAEPTVGRQSFTGWWNERGEKISDEPTLNLTLTDNTRVSSSYAEILSSGDVNQDGVIDARDIDLLCAAVLAGDSSSEYDLDANGVIDVADHNFLVTTLLKSGAGDANLDGRFDSSDWITAFQAGTYETGRLSAWADGDWNCDGQFNSADFVAAFTKGWYEAP